MRLAKVNKNGQTFQEFLAPTVKLNQFSKHRFIVRIMTNETMKKIVRYPGAVSGDESTIVDIKVQLESPGSRFFSELVEN